MRQFYEAIFGSLPDLTPLPANAGPVADAMTSAAWGKLSAEEQEQVTRIYVNLGKAIAAYERRLLPTPSRFDAYVEAVLKEDTATIPESVGRQWVVSTFGRLRQRLRDGG